MVTGAAKEAFESDRRAVLLAELIAMIKFAKADLELSTIMVDSFHVRAQGVCRLSMKRKKHLFRIPVPRFKPHCLKTHTPHIIHYIFNLEQGQKHPNIH